MYGTRYTLYTVQLIQEKQNCTVENENPCIIDRVKHTI